MGNSKGFSILLAAVYIGLLASCNQVQFEVLKDTVTVEVPIINRVTKANYMNGEQFCARYVNSADIKSKEIGKWVEVPFNYGEQNRTIKIYTYTKKIFNPKLPTYIFIDGGPGQNTHTFSDIVESDFNEIHFDQRGVGCSAPPTWEEYSDNNLYSSLNTARDIEEIRKAYSVGTLSVYGVSYGTIPATIYANLYENNVRAVVLEGVVGRIENLSRYTFSVEKYNLLVESLNAAQKEAFEGIIFGEDRKKKFVVQYLMGTAGYHDGGYRAVRDRHFDKLFPKSGGLDSANFERVYINILKSQNPYDTAQHPGAVDDNVLTRFYCKELGGFSKDKFDLNYSKDQGFYETLAKDKSTWAEECARVGVTVEMEKLYDERNYPTTASVYYFQGSHDGATIAEGALTHWKFVPNKKSYFLLAKKGGHNPALSRLKSQDVSISTIHRQLYVKALNGQEIDTDFILKLNKSIGNTPNEDDKNFNFITWSLFTNNKSDFIGIEKEFNGLKLFDWRSDK